MAHRKSSVGRSMWNGKLLTTIWWVTLKTAIIHGCHALQAR
jgi:hypothetical protein